MGSIEFIWACKANCGTMAALKRFRVYIITGAMLFVFSTFFGWFFTYKYYARLASEALSKGKYFLALQYASSASKINPLAAFPHFVKGHVYLTLEDYPRAEKEFLAAWIRSRGNPLYNAYLGYVRFLQGKYKKAVLPLKRAIKHDKEVAWYHALLGSCYVRLGNWENAFYCFMRALSLEPVNFEIYENLISVFPHAPQKIKEDASYKLALSFVKGLREELAGNWKKAIEYYRMFVSLAPKAYFIRNRLATCYDLIGDVKTAVSEFQRSLEVNPSQPEIKQVLAEARSYTKLPEAGEYAFLPFEETVLVVADGKDSKALSYAKRYMKKHSVPEKNLIVLSQFPKKEVIDYREFEVFFKDPLEKLILERELLNCIDFIVLIGDFPYYISGRKNAVFLEDETSSLESELSLLFHLYIKSGPIANPYFYRDFDPKGMVDMARDFSRKKYGIYLVSRLHPAESSELISPSLRVYVPELKNGFNRLIKRLKIRKAELNEFVDVSVEQAARPTSWGLLLTTRPDNLFEWLKEGGAGGIVYSKDTFGEPDPRILVATYFSGYNSVESLYLSIPYISWPVLVYGDPFREIPVQP